MAKSDKALDVVDIDQFKYTSQAGTAAARRRAIKTLLDTYSIVIMPHKFDAADLDGSPYVEGPCPIEGTTWVLARGNTSDYTYPITSGKKVCFCIQDAASVTGIDPDWNDDEYRIVGTALESFSSTGPTVIMVKLEAQPKAHKLPVRGQVGSMANATALEFTVEISGGNNAASGCGEFFPMRFEVAQSSHPAFNGSPTATEIKLKWKDEVQHVPIITNAWLDGNYLKLRKQHIALPSSMFCGDYTDISVNISALVSSIVSSVLPSILEATLASTLSGYFCDTPSGTKLFGMIDGELTCFEVSECTT